MPVQTQMQVRRGTASSWTSTNPTLAAGELGFETDTGKFKIGTGSSTWTALPYAGGGAQATFTTYQYTATAAQTTFSGVDANGNTLAYTAGSVQVYLNGALLQDTADYAATNGTSVVLTTGALVGDSLTVIALGTFTVSTDIPKSTLTAKGSIVAASAASTPANLSVGADNSVLTADSTTATGLKWAVITAGATINYEAFTSSTTWTVPTSAKYVDVFVVGGGTGGRGGSRSTTIGARGGAGGAITMLDNIYLGGTGTVSIVVGAGSSGTAGVATTLPTDPSAAGYSGFGAFCYSGGSYAYNGGGGVPGYKGSYQMTSGAELILGNDTNQANWGPLFFGFANSTGVDFFSNSSSSVSFKQVFSLNAYGVFGGHSGASSTTANQFRAGTHPGSGATVVGSNITTNTLPTNVSSIYFTPIGAATAGTSGQGATGTGGAAGQTGFAGGGGAAIPTANALAGQGGPGGGGGGSWPASAGLNGGNGGNAGSNTGAGGGGGGCTGDTGSGTGGNGGNGAAGIVIVKWIS
jgi:hypothetical protein